MTADPRRAAAEQDVREELSESHRSELEQIQRAERLAEENKRLRAERAALVAEVTQLREENTALRKEVLRVQEITFFNFGAAFGLKLCGHTAPSGAGWQDRAEPYVCNRTALHGNPHSDGVFSWDNAAGGDS